MYSSCHSGQGGINVAILIMGYFSAFSCRMPDPRSRPAQLLIKQDEWGRSVDRRFAWFDLNRQQGNPVLTQGFPLLCHETFVVGGLQSRSQGFQTLH
jgi:hypothetical protein